MGGYTANVSEVIEREPDDAGNKAAIGTICLNACVELDEAYRTVILGDTDEVLLWGVQRMKGPYPSTTLLCESRRNGGLEVQEADIREVAKRMERLLNDPGSAARIMDENPFYRLDG